MPTLRARDQPRAQRVSLDISKHRKQMMILLNEEGLVSALPEPARASICLMVSTDVRRHQPAHPLCEICIVDRPHDEVKVVRHEADGEDRECHAILRFGHGCEKSCVVMVAVKYPRLLIATVDDVIALVCNDHSGRTRHEAHRIARTALHARCESRGCDEFCHHGRAFRAAPFC